MPSNTSYPPAMTKATAAAASSCCDDTAPKRAALLAAWFPFPASQPNKQSRQTLPLQQWSHTRSSVRVTLSKRRCYVRPSPHTTIGERLKYSDEGPQGVHPSWEPPMLDLFNFVDPVSIPSSLLCDFVEASSSVPDVEYNGRGTDAPLVGANTIGPQCCHRNHQPRAAGRI